MRGEGESCGVLANEYSCANHVTWSQNKLWGSTSMFNLWPSVSTTPVANLPPVPLVSLVLVANLLPVPSVSMNPVGELPPVSTTPVAVNDTSGKEWEQYEAANTFQWTWRKKFIYMLTLLHKGVQTKYLKHFWLKIFSICHWCHRNRWCTLRCKYLRECLTPVAVNDTSGK